MKQASIRLARVFFRESIEFLLGLFEAFKKGSKAAVDGSGAFISRTGIWGMFRRRAKWDMLV